MYLKKYKCLFKYQIKKESMSIEENITWAKINELSKKNIEKLFNETLNEILSFKKQVLDSKSKISDLENNLEKQNLLASELENNLKGQKLLVSEQNNIINQIKADSLALDMLNKDELEAVKKLNSQLQLENNMANKSILELEMKLDDSQAKYEEFLEKTKNKIIVGLFIFALALTLYYIYIKRDYIIYKIQRFCLTCLNFILGIFEFFFSSIFISKYLMPPRSVELTYN
jgi:hypothetical protein